MPDPFSSFARGLKSGREMRDQKSKSAMEALLQQRELESYDQAVPEGYVRFGKQILEDKTHYNPAREREKASIKAEEEARAFGRMKDMFGSNNLPPGTTGRFGNLTVPLNPKLTETETNAVAAQETYPKVLQEVNDLVKGGVLNSGRFGNVGRTVKQMGAESKNPLMTHYNPKLQKLQSKLAKAKELMFERGGKALTPAEIGIVGQAFVLTGKSDQQILEDIEAADQIIESKARLALGGANVARFGQQQNQNPQSDPLEAEAQAAIQAGADPNVVMQRLQQLKVQRG